MASNPRKRPADLTWRAPIASKTPKLFDADTVTTASEERRKSALEAHMISRRSKLSDMVPHSQGDLNTYASNTLPTPKVVSTWVSKPLKAYPILPSKVPVPAAPCPKNPPTPIWPIQCTTYKPAVLHQPHPLGMIGQNRHWVPYPLGLMPYDSWYRLHRGSGSGIQAIPALRCPVCGGKREVTAQVHKLFLVAERLIWEGGLMSVYDKEINTYLNSRLNSELNIRSPMVNDPEHVPGGNYSKTNRFHPYYNEHEMMLAFKLLFMAENLTEATWSLWIEMQLAIEKMLGAGKATGTFSPGSMTGGPATNTTSHDRASEQLRHPPGLPTPPSCSSEESLRGKAFSKTPTTTASSIHTGIFVVQESQSITEPTAYPHRSKRILGYRSLQDFYALLDQIERSSNVGALFLEAYAERLRDDLCKDCWFAHNARLDIFQVQLFT